jgi:hypothetical protein
MRPIQVARSLNAGGSAFVNAIVCTGPTGDCVAAGQYADAKEGFHAFVVTERGGIWGTAQQVAAQLNRSDGAEVLAAACANPGNCVAGGTYLDARAIGQAFVVQETNGTWDPAEKVAGADNREDARVTSVSCSPTGHWCVAGGYLTAPGIQQQAFVVNDNHGTWGRAVMVASAVNRRHDASVTTVSCPAPGSCSAGGSYFFARSDELPFVIDQSHGVWGAARTIRPTWSTLPSGAIVNSISCYSAHNCVAVGTQMDPKHREQAFDVSEVRGRWYGPQDLSSAVNGGQGGWLGTVSCWSSGECIAGGALRNSSGRPQASGSIHSLRG